MPCLVSPTQHKRPQPSFSLYRLFLNPYDLQCQKLDPASFVLRMCSLSIDASPRCSLTRPLQPFPPCTIVCCGGLKENSPHRLIVSGIIRRHRPVGGSASLGVDFEVLDTQARPSVAFSFCCLPTAPSPSPRLPMCHRASCHDDNGLRL